ncbi:MAG: LuxR C-terminal-related transcriptional regulator [Pseudomonadota bacterium]
MKYFDETVSEESYRVRFAAELASLAGADFAHMGFYDCATQQFTESWSGTAQSFAPVSNPKDGRDASKEIARILAEFQSDRTDPAFDITRARSDGYVIGIGDAVDRKVPVIALRVGTSDNETSQDSCLELGLSYVAQQLKDAVSRQPVAMGEAVETALGALSINLAVVDAYGQIDYCTDFSKEWLEEYGGFEINLRRLSGKTQKLQRTFHQALALATGPNRQASTVAIDLDKRVSRIAVVLPLERSDPPRAVVILEQSDKDPELGHHLLKLFGLTNSECLIAHHLLEGKSLIEIAEVTNLSLSTVRSYLKGIFAKTSTHRQGQFITYFHNTVPRVKYIPVIGEQSSKPAR